MFARTIVCVASFAFVAPAFAADDPPPQNVAIQSGGLAEKLVAGSPWRFTTKYENTIHHFRFSSDGKVQRMSPTNPDVWKDFAITEMQTSSYETKNGHVITFSLDADGYPTTTHSKHASQFQSIR